MPPELRKHIVDLAEYQEWMAHTFLAMPLLWPDFVLVNDLLLRKAALPEDWEAFQQAAHEAGWLPFQIEYVVNHVHMEDLFWKDPYFPQIDTAALDYLATTLAEMWRAKLHLQFPDRAIVVEVNNLGISPEVFASTRP